MSETSKNGPLADLERRWGDERSPQLTLHLAEEHRRFGNLKRALEVVREGLEHHPAHVAARVALGRFLFEDGQSSAAFEALEAVVAEDPTHLVANKLLVSVCLEVGDPDRARDRLGLYKTLNVSDPDIESLEEKILESATASEPPESDDISEQSQPDIPAGSERDPFGDFWSTPDQSAYRSALVGEGIFQLTEPPEADETTEDQSERAEIPATVVAPADVPAEAPAEVPVEEPAEAPSEAPSGAIADAPSEGDLDARVEGPAEATVTLGRLYLEQGHVEEAERIFRAVLDREPANADAEAGLKETLGSETELKATDLVDPDTLAGAGVVERKRLVLESYGSRLRAASAKDEDV